MKRVTICLFTLCAVLTLASCTVYTYTPTETPYTPGEYTETVDGHNGKVTVRVVFDASRITEIEVLSHEESASIGDAAMQAVADAVIRNQGFDVDTVSGATFSSVAMLQAVSLAAQKAGADAETITMDTLGYASADEETGEDQAAEGGLPAPPYIPGEYSASVFGFGGNITVTVTVDEDGILSITADGPSETSGIGSVAVDTLPDTILEAGSVDVDGVAGATSSSKAIKTAVVKALEKAK